MSRAARATLLALLVSASASAAARADTTVVVNHGGVATTLAVGQLATDVDAQYPIRGSVNGATVDQTIVGTSVGEILTLAGDDPTTGFAVVHFQDNQGAPERSVLTPADLAGTDQPQGLKPVVSPNDDSADARLFYVRPLSADPNDTNPELEVDPTLEIDDHDGSPLHVSVSAAQANPAVGAPVTLSASVTNATLGLALTYTWQFSDGPAMATTTPSITHAFSTSGQQWAVVSVTDPDDDAGAATADIPVGSPPPGPGSAGPTTPTPAPTPAPSGSGPVVTTQTPTVTSATSSAPVATQPRQPAVVPKHHAAPTTTTSAPATTFVPAPTPVSPVPATPAGPATRPAPVATSRTPSRHHAAGKLVAGQLLSAPIVISPSATTRRPTAPRDVTDAGSGTSPAGAVGGGLAVWLLLGAGVLRERRGRWWRRLHA